MVSARINEQNGAANNNAPARYLLRLLSIDTGAYSVIGKWFERFRSALSAARAATASIIKYKNAHFLGMLYFSVPIAVNIVIIRDATGHLAAERRIVFAILRIIDSLDNDLIG
jgi:hypothetical protein